MSLRQFSVSPRRALAAVLLAALVTVGIAACASTPAGQGGTTAEPTVALPTGTVGAANFDAGYLAVGTGTKTVDLYFDPMCPYCQAFETANGAKLASAATDGSITLRLHPLTFLDRSSNGTAYSSRAAAALTCVATLDPKSTLGYLALLYKDQPKEGTSGLTDAQLDTLATGLGAPSIADCLAKGTYQAWAEYNTNKALAGPLPDADIKAIQGTPTILVNGHSYAGSITDTAAFASFLASH
jgi:protein-disulfide isomerase